MFSIFCYSVRVDLDDFAGRTIATLSGPVECLERDIPDEGEALRLCREYYAVYNPAAPAVVEWRFLIVED